MGKEGMMLCLALALIMTRGAADAEKRAWKSMEERSRVWEEIQGKEIWRKELGKERSLLLYIEETGERRICFTDGPWFYMTEALVDQVEAAGLRFWRDQVEGIKQGGITE